MTCVHGCPVEDSTISEKNKVGGAMRTKLQKFDTQRQRMQPKVMDPGVFINHQI
jgi:hypothetical protein